MVQVRVVRHVTELANIAVNAVPRANIQNAKEQEPANGATTVNVIVAKVVEKTDAVTVSVMVFVREDAEALEHIWVALAQRAKVMEDAPNAMDLVPQGPVPVVLEAEDAIHVMAVTNARHVKERGNVPSAVDSPNAVPVEATVTVPNAKTTTANVPTVPATAMFG